MSEPETGFNRYFSNSEIESQLRAWEKEYPRLIEVAQLGESHEKRPIWIVTLTNRDTGPSESKPALWADANLHATELAGTTVILALISTLLGRHAGGDAQARRILDSSALYLAPRLCPDGAERVTSLAK